MDVERVECVPGEGGSPSAMATVMVGSIVVGIAMQHTIDFLT